MQVLVIPSWYYSAENPVSGIFFKEQAQALAALKEVEVGLMYGKFDWRESLFSQVSSDRTDGFLTVRGKAWAPPKVTRLGLQIWLFRYLSLFEAYRKRAGLPELIHAHSWVAGLAARSVSMRYDIPYILSEHLSSVNEGKLSARQSRFARLAYQDAAALTAVSQQMADKMVELVPNRSVFVVPNSVDTMFFQPKSKLRVKPSVLLSIGDPWHKKGHDISVKALSLLRQKGCHFELWLGDKIPGRRALIKMIEAEGVSGQVKFLGLLTREQVREVMQKADIYISASRVEPFGVTIIEALCSGLPVIATKTAGGLDIIGDQEELGALVAIDEEDELSEAILELTNRYDSFDPTYMHSTTAGKFSQGAVALQTLDVYKEVLNDHRT
jgi:L-malate glycosyltransferase